MKAQFKPMLLTLAVALAGASSAHAQSYGNGNTTQPGMAPSTSSATGMAAPMQSTDSDANEAQARRSRTTAEEEHGGVRGWASDKMNRTSARVRGMSGTQVGNGPMVDDSGGLSSNGHVTGR
ncbi:MAG: hypothetical protein M3Z31_11295 [Pseudomonadota bacterium]|nr:hypothetical protein [Pseudomonadota bacterium]